jgi:hypothetical protein
MASTAGVNLPSTLFPVTINDLFGKEEWFYCLDHRAVEPETGCRDEVRLGPYRSREEAEAALEKVEERNQDWEEDPAWNDEDE